MKRIVSICIGIIFALLQTILPLASESVQLHNRLAIAVMFVVVWILYSVYSDNVDEFICSVLGRERILQDRKTKIQMFNDIVVPASCVINESVVKKMLLNDFEIQYLYNVWCRVIHFFVSFCVIHKNGWEIDFSIMRQNKSNRLWVTRDKYIDLKYAKSIIQVMIQFDQQYGKEIDNQLDYAEFKNQLNKLKGLFTA